MLTLRPEIDLLASLDHLAIDAIELCGILRVGIGLRIELLNFNLALRDLAEFAEEILNALRVGLEEDRHVVLATRAVEPNLHRRIQFLDNVARPFGERVGALGREIDALLGAGCDDVERD
jgi:hypothetical protein